jgi:dimeric dUTPase (all-alpha-NTP-PPase superfamily)
MEENTSEPKSEVKDKLEYLFEEQKRLIQNMDHATNKMQDIYKIQQIFDGYRIFMLSSAMLHEIIELQRETNWKWWKTPNPISIDRCQEEVIDMWHFLIQLSIELGMDANTIVNKYLEKHKENMNRQKQGY